MKKIIMLVLSLTMFFALSLNVNALEGYTTDSAIRVRKEPTVNSDKIDTISSIYTTLDVVEDKLYNVGDSDCSSGWYKINYNGEVGYICALYASLGKTPTSVVEEVAINTDTYEARIGAVGVSVRTSPSTSANGTKLLPGTNIVVISEHKSGNGCDDNWYKVRYYDNKEGYVCSTYVNKKENITASDSEYEQILKDKGFPDSYIPYLVYLHNLHPTWTFNAINTDLYWGNVISGEEGKNLIQTNVSNYVVNFIAKEGDSWFASNNATNAFYLDPRNFLTERFIFMFENLNYKYDEEVPEELDKESEITKKYYESVSEIFDGSYLNTEEYIYDYIDAGFKYNVSPVHLASRSKQEGATDETYPAVSGEEERMYGSYSLKGYYNMFNIGAYKDKVTDSPVLRGLAYACGSACGFYDTYGRAWTSIEKAIYGGAEYIASGYIADGQNTLYFEKFNTSPSSHSYSYTNQYQTNLLAPCAEGESAYEAYVEQNLLEEEFIFDIPVYLDMPSSVSLPSILSSVNSLKAIKIDGTLIKDFDKDILSYQIKVSDKTEKIKITATKDDSKSTVTGTGDIKLKEDVNTIKIVVTSEMGTTRTYEIVVTKVKDTTTVDDILSKLSFKEDNNLLFNISPDTYVSDLETVIKGISEETNVAVKDNNGQLIDSKTSLKTGYKVNIITPNMDQKEFDIVVIGDTSGDGEVTILDLLQVQKYLLNEKVFDKAYLKAADTNNDGEVNILDLLRIQKYLLKDLNF